jgi:hypothetical protein
MPASVLCSCLVAGAIFRTWDPPPTTWMFCQVGLNPRHEEPAHFSCNRESLAQKHRLHHTVPVPVGWDPIASQSDRARHVTAADPAGLHATRERGVYHRATTAHSDLANQPSQPPRTRVPGEDEKGRKRKQQPDPSPSGERASLRRPRPSLIGVLAGSGALVSVETPVGPLRIVGGCFWLDRSACFCFIRLIGWALRSAFLASSDLACVAYTIPLPRSGLV